MSRVLCETCRSAAKLRFRANGVSFPPVVILSGAKDLCIFVRMNAWRVSVPRVLCETWAGGPFKPGFGLSGAVLPLDKVFQPRARVFAPSIPTRSLRVLQCRVPHVSRCLRDVQISGKVAFRANGFHSPPLSS
jgi:hypothetical protein